MFRQILGQDHAVQLLNKAVLNDRVAQGYLFHGIDGVGKYTTALYFALALNCLSASEFRPCGVCASCRKFLAYEHPDFFYIFPTPNFKMSSNGEIKDATSLAEYERYIDVKRKAPWMDFVWSGATEIRKESIMMLQHRLDLSIHEAKYRVCIIESADQMNASTANAFLKTLEEPPDNTVIILITERLPALLPTILSRCQTLYFNPLPRKVIETMLHKKLDVENAMLRTASLISNGNFKTAFRIASDDKSEQRLIAKTFLELACSGNELEFHQIMTKSRELLTGGFVSGMINYLSTFINDIVILKYDPAGITNVDYQDLLMNISARNDEIDETAYRLLTLLEDMKRKIDGHVNINLVIVHLFYSLFRELKAI
ncbi:MAG: DNA polymerase III subunit delta' [Candidatus Cloacimonetes bacterium HGW-Cloacimonetes-1]|jgi:DNA polymerase-3 subunit delta'|nr:MAG: DNA polymerase III subunit delta' [Candidatus Cloacimonetes bacterium HGW-Cloacimonetes-1]